MQCRLYVEQHSSELVSFSLSLVVEFTQNSQVIIFAFRCVSVYVESIFFFVVVRVFCFRIIAGQMHHITYKTQQNRNVSAYYLSLYSDIIKRNKQNALHAF